MASHPGTAPGFRLGLDAAKARLGTVVVPVLASVCGLLVGALILAAAGVDPVEGYTTMAEGALGSPEAMSAVLVAAVPLLTIALGLALAFRARVWNIGAEGQFHLGALAGGALVILLPLGSGALAIPLAFIAGALGGAAWGFLPGLFRARWGVNEIVTSLLLNYVAIFGFQYAVRRPLRDPEGFLPESKPIPSAAELGSLPGLDAHAGVLVAVALVPLMAYLLVRTPFGLRTTLIGLNDEAASASGTRTGRMVITVMMISGAFAGLAGIIQILGVQGLLQQGISPGFGFTAIIVALLGRLNPLGVLFAALFVAALTVGGEAMQVSLGLTGAVVLAIQAVLILLLLVADRLTATRRAA